ncbi:MAG: TRAP transporter substrate-binding protein [Treponema sp.]|nr:TRAP transporter substrate-binding protein [Treponema sp.]
MKKYIAAFFAIASVSVLFTSCFLKKDDMKISKRPVRLRLSEVHAKGYPTSLADEEFARLVEERTNGRVIIEVRTGGSISSIETDSIKALQSGDLAFTRVSAAPVATFVPKLNAIMLPYLYKSSEHMWNVLNGRIGQEMLDDIEKSDSGLIGLCYYDGGSRNFYLTKEVHSVADFAGLRIRVQNNPMMIDMCRYLGAEGVVGIGADTVYNKIVDGVIDGAENNWPTYQSMGDYKVANYYILDQHTRIPEILIASKAAMQRVSSEDLRIIKQVARETCAFEIKRWKEKEQASEKIVRAHGNTIVELTQAQYEEFQNAMAPLYEEYGSAYMSTINAIKSTN